MMLYLSNKSLTLVEDRVNCVRSKQEGSCTLSAPLEQRTKFTVASEVEHWLVSLQEYYTTPSNRNKPGSRMILEQKLKSCGSRRRIHYAIWCPNH